MRARLSPSLAGAGLLALLLPIGCGGISRRPPEDCEEGQVLANPDGRGMRCIDAESECFDPAACTTPDPCCIATCEDPERDAKYACGVHCEVPACSASDPASCRSGERCEVYGACQAACVPDLPCPDGQVLANPTGAGFVCVPVDSECFHPDDCAPSTDPCCTTSCGPDGERFACVEDCEGGAVGAGIWDGAPEEDRAWECHRDADCEGVYGAGWVCVGCPGWCELSGG